MAMNLVNGIGRSRRPSQACDLDFLISGRFSRVFGGGYQVGVGHGGKRAGAGRKSTRDRFPAQVEAVEEKLAAELENLLRIQITAAKMGQRQVTEVRVPAALATVLISDRLPDGSIRLDDYGKPINVRVFAFPDLAVKNPDEMVVIRRLETWTPPSLAAGNSLIDRVLGRPVSLTDSNDGDDLPPIPTDAKAAVDKAYGGDDSEDEQGEDERL